MFAEEKEIPKDDADNPVNEKKPPDGSDWPTFADWPDGSNWPDFSDWPTFEDWPDMGEIGKDIGKQIPPVG